MKTTTSICLSLIVSFAVISPANAAKENFDRSKPHVQVGHGLDNDCNSIKANKNGKRATTITVKQARCASANGIGGGHVTVLKARAQNNAGGASQSNTTRAQDYNSSRSNRGVNYQDGNDLVLRKRPGRTKLTSPESCVKAKPGVKAKTKANCPVKKPQQPSKYLCKRYQLSIFNKRS